MHRRAENKSVRLGSLLHELINGIIYAALPETLFTSAAADTAGNGLVPYPEYLCGYAQAFQNGGGLLHCHVGAAVLVGTSVYQ